MKVYSNQNEVSLYVDGALLETQSGRTVFTFQMPITGEHTVEAVSGVCRDMISIRKADSPDPAYQFQKAEVVNWFDREGFKPDCFSIRDTLGELLAHPKDGTIVGRMMVPVFGPAGETWPRPPRGTPTCKR